MTYYWDEDDEAQDYEVPDDVVDMAFRISCACLPIDHANALSKALHEVLPWLAEENDAGIHVIHGAASGNGWVRPEDPAHDVLYPSRRTRMTLRLPKARVENTRGLTGAVLDIDGHGLTVGEASVRPLAALPTLFARYVVADPGQDESRFLEATVEELKALGVPVRKVLCGRTGMLRRPEGDVFTRSVLVADLDPQESVTLQQRGLGPLRRMGCGLFIGHKGIRAVDEAAGARSRSRL
ncbi:MAG: type I-MYXAN CRISPR-associated protein Cas6/Cmx6 [Gammaproteobacteria bacterium]|nr:type I-MYXAN CRISPR-associated protein Cas6/Cmx6 [Gammaproteobacteria bacterium]NIR81666.1 type I-MYXAN CRISPR-associated protein Cas6/Cmx6 [Gammaproteobacteria bacterium]NIU02700.1 type I-MYXAN CRISPR-associated protein Cas6/Cmx6 [Gammaproteobacteria bacterium]NIV73402.1 type I-MYXAN CRISPR-associated protein Cas6/Cmx6 [Gammaproteobacteria bacterium]NIX83975.1 type I-MYXAN CRISPR-associated protein Cas6/Cmx6 [Gammaproteobacteria bacterium]